MLSSSRRFIVPLFAFLSLFLASVDAYDTLLQQRGHAHLHMKRVMRKRAPLPQEPVIGAAPLPIGTHTTRSTTTLSTETSAPASATTTSTTLAGTQTSTTLTSTTPTSSSPLSASKSASATASAVSSTPQSQTVSASDGPVGVSTIIGPNRTLTASVQPSETVVPDQQGNTSSSQIKSTTLTVIIAIVASVGGVFILWTIFRKWKLSRSKEFDRRLNPIDWQPTTADDEEHIPGQNRLRPTSPTSSTGHNSAGLARTPSSQGHSNPFDDFDSPVQSSAPVGGYADLARGTKPAQMQERLQYNPSYNQGATPVPLHHQGGYGGGH